MLAPGDYLTSPVPPEPNRERVTRLGDVKHDLEQRPTILTAKTEEPEPRSFLLILLRALGAVHS
jgi:hypothetical protein